MSEYLSKEEIKKWRSSVEKITLEEYAARLGKKLQEEKKTNDLADMLYTHFNPAQTPADYDTVTKLEKIDLTPKTTHTKPKKQTSKNLPELDDLDMEESNLTFEEAMENMESKVVKEKPAKKEVKKSEPAKKETKKAEAVKKEIVKEEKQKKKETSKENKVEVKKEVTSKTKPAKEAKKVEKPAKTTAKKEKSSTKKAEKAGKTSFESLNITFKKPLTEREEKVLAYFMEKKGKIVFAKDLAELLDLKRDYIYKYIKNLRAKMSTDLLANADNGGFVLN